MTPNLSLNQITNGVVVNETTNNIKDCLCFEKYGMWNEIEYFYSQIESALREKDCV
jgi:hypothetical protein